MRSGGFAGTGRLGHVVESDNSSGKQMTPGGATQLMEILGKDESLSRIRAAIEKLRKNERKNGDRLVHVYYVRIKRTKRSEWDGCKAASLKDCFLML